MTTQSKQSDVKRMLPHEPTIGSDAQFMTRGVIYARYSHGSNQTDQSLEGQLRDCRKYASEHDIAIVEEYLDPHISGKEAEKRPEFQRMIRDSDKHQFEVVIVWKTDRFARNRYDSARYKERLKRNGVTVQYAAEHIPDTAEGIILESLLEGMAEYYSADLRQKVLRGMRESAYKCKALTRPPLGYTLDAEKHYVIDEKIAPHIQQIFQMYVNGDSTAKIADRMNAIGLRTTRKGPFNINTVRRIVENEKYTGVYEYKAGGIRIENAFPAIVEKDLFLEAQARRHAMKNGTYSTRNYGGSAKHIYLLSGIVYCGDCGSTMFGETVKKNSRNSADAEYGYYSCNRRRTKGKHLCKSKAIPKELLEGVVKRAVQEVIFSPAVFDTICGAVIQVDLKRNILSKLKSLKQSKKEKEIALKNILDAVENGFYSDSILKRLKALESEIQSIDLEIQKCDSTQVDIRERIRWMFSSFVTENTENEKYWNEIIHCFVKSVTCFRNGTVVIRFNLYNAPSHDGPVLELGVEERLDHYNADSITASENICGGFHYPHQSSRTETFGSFFASLPGTAGITKNIQTKNSPERTSFRGESVFCLLLAVN